VSTPLGKGDRVVVARCPDEPQLQGKTGRILQPEGRLWLIALDGGAAERFPSGTALVYPEELDPAPAATAHQEALTAPAETEGSGT
jgi:hypothetical protein